MDFTPPPPGPPAPEPNLKAAAVTGRRRRLPHAAMAGGLVFGMALGGAGIAFAAGSGSGSTTTNPPANPNVTPASPPAPGGRHPGRAGRAFGGMGGLAKFGLGGRVLYGSATIETPSGATKTVDFQVGTVGSVSTTSITVDSPNHSQTYTVDPTTIVDSQENGIGSVKQGDTVVILAESNGSGNATAMDIRDQTQMKSSRHGFGFAAPPTSNSATNSGSNNGTSAGETWGPGGSQLQ
jgi:hypothetical protein